MGGGGWRHKQSAALSPAPCLCCVTAVLMLCPRVSERPIVLRICKNDPHTQQLKLDPGDHRAQWDSNISTTLQKNYFKASLGAANRDKPPFSPRDDLHPVY